MRRDSVIWTLMFLAAVLAYGLSHTHLVPVAYVENVKDVATMAGFIAAYLKSSPLGPGRVDDMEPPKEKP